mmetsp:Transcript_8359/g.20347  ORF Transcript_8359/g.20347 Transcript_8359/m.20347 type:complete len:302 (+) Transcript_8359:645-1550(+)
MEAPRHLCVVSQGEVVAHEHLLAAAVPLNIRLPAVENLRVRHGRFLEQRQDVAAAVSPPAHERPRHVIPCAERQHSDRHLPEQKPLLADFLEVLQRPPHRAVAAAHDEARVRPVGRVRLESCLGSAFDDIENVRIADVLPDLLDQLLPLLPAGLAVDEGDEVDAVRVLRPTLAPRARGRSHAPQPLDCPLPLLEVFAAGHRKSVPLVRGVLWRLERKGGLHRRLDPRNPRGVREIDEAVGHGCLFAVEEAQLCPVELRPPLVHCLHHGVLLLEKPALHIRLLRLALAGSRILHVRKGEVPA